VIPFYNDTTIGPNLLPLVSLMNDVVRNLQLYLPRQMKYFNEIDSRICELTNVRIINNSTIAVELPHRDPV
jgi:hypothetical protein